MIQLTEAQWRIIAKAIAFVDDVCGEARAKPILELIGPEGETAALQGVLPATSEDVIAE